MSGQAETIRSCVAMLARCSIGISLKDWSDLSGNLLEAAAHIDRLEASHAELVAALERIATVDMGGGFLGAQACRQVARAALPNAKALEVGNGM